jgi:hypothetical protein
MQMTAIYTGGSIMTPSIEELKTTLAALPPSDREEIADYLLSTLDFADDVKQEWLDLAEERLTEIRTGQATGVPAEEVLRDLLEPDK